MFNPIFSLSDIPKVLILIFIEWVLSSDNAIVLATFASKLKKELQKKALFIGLISAFFFRAIAIFFVAYLIQFMWLQVLGGIYLLYLAIRHFFPVKIEEEKTSPPSFWKTVFLIEFTDLIFAFDSIFAGVAFIMGSFANSTYLHKLWIVYVGVFIGIIGVRFAAQFFMKMLFIFSRLLFSAHMIIGGLGAHLILNAFLRNGWLHFHSITLDFIFWSWIIGFLIFGFSKRNLNEKR